MGLNCVKSLMKRLDMKRPPFAEGELKWRGVQGLEEDDKS